MARPARIASPTLVARQAPVLDPPRTSRPLLDGITLERHPEALIVRSVDPIQVLASAVLGGGRGPARTIVNLGVPLDYDGSSPARDLRAFARRNGLPGPLIGLMTAAPLDEVRLLRGSADAIELLSLVTVGLRNAVRAGDESDARGPGTINAIFLCDGRLAEAAAVELVMIAAEAKASALAEAEVRTELGTIATGTSTDAIVVGWRAGRGSELRHAGSATAVGRLAARMMREALRS